LVDIKKKKKEKDASNFISKIQDGFFLLTISNIQSFVFKKRKKSKKIGNYQS